MIAVVADFDIGSVQVEADVAQVFFLLSRPRREFVGWTFTSGTGRSASGVLSSYIDRSGHLRKLRFEV